MTRRSRFPGCVLLRPASDGPGNMDAAPAAPTEISEHMATLVRALARQAARDAFAAVRSAGVSAAPPPGSTSRGYP